jgi:carbon starvation protein
LGDGRGPVFPGSMFPFAFITIACGAISGFHALISSGTTPKLIAKESEARFIGYGSMLMESFVAIMALIAACALTPGLYFVLNSPRAMLGADAVSAAHVVSSWGFVIRPEDITQLAASLEEKSIIARTGGAPTLAVGMAQIFSSFTKGWGGEHAPAFWYHFAIMFEALFILTTVDAGTRVGRFIFQDLLGQFHKPLGEYHHPIGLWGGSLVIVAGWGYFLITGISDPLGGIYILWPLFGIANQVLAAMALSIVTVILFRMHKARWSFLTLGPLAWLVAVTETAGIEKLASADPKIGFLAQAADYAKKIVGGGSPDDLRKWSSMLFNARIDAALCAIFIGVILIVVVTCAHKCMTIARQPK